MRINAFFPIELVAVVILLDLQLPLRQRYRTVVAVSDAFAIATASPHSFAEDLDRRTDGKQCYRAQCFVFALV